MELAETETSHRPGIQIVDVQELLEHGSKVVVLSRGMAECLHVPRDTLDFLKERQIAVHVLPTQHAVALYNKLAQTEAVVGLSVRRAECESADKFLSLTARALPVCVIFSRALDFIQRCRVF